MPKSGLSSPKKASSRQSPASKVGSVSARSKSPKSPAAKPAVNVTPNVPRQNGGRGRPRKEISSSSGGVVVLVRYLCPLCSRELSSAEALKEHFEASHTGHTRSLPSEEVLLEGEEAKRCRVCGQDIFPSYSAWVEHLLGENTRSCGGAALLPHSDEVRTVILRRLLEKSGCEEVADTFLKGLEAACQERRVRNFDARLAKSPATSPSTRLRRSKLVEETVSFSAPDDKENAARNRQDLSVSAALKKALRVAPLRDSEDRDSEIRRHDTGDTSVTQNGKDASSTPPSVHPEESERKVDRAEDAVQTDSVTKKDEDHCTGPDELPLEEVDEDTINNVEDDERDVKVVHSPSPPSSISSQSPRHAVRRNASKSSVGPIRGGNVAGDLRLPPRDRQARATQKT
jgi:hypothetical protein